VASAADPEARSSWPASARLRSERCLTCWRLRFRRFVVDAKQATALPMLAECAQVLRGVPRLEPLDRLPSLRRAPSGSGRTATRCLRLPTDRSHDRARSMADRSRCAQLAQLLSTGEASTRSSEISRRVRATADVSCGST
jgi:hypothetical protein